MWLKTEARGPPASLPCSPGIRCWELRKRKNQTLLVRKERESYNNVITYFHEIIRIHKCGDKHLPSRTTAQAGCRWMDGEETEDREVKVSPESIRDAMSRRAGQG